MQGDTAVDGVIAAVEMQAVSVVSTLPDAFELTEGSRHCGADGPETPLSVSGNFVLEVFAGECALTLAMLVSRLPCLRPWDSLFGERDVASYGMASTSSSSR